MTTDRSISYVIQGNDECTELQVAWQPGGYTATLLRYETSEWFDDLIATSDKAQAIQVAHKPAQRFDRRTLVKLAEYQRDLLLTNKHADTINELPYQPEGARR